MIHKQKSAAREEAVLAGGGSWGAGELEGHADQCLQNAGIAQCARSRLRHCAEAGDVERTIGIAPKRSRCDRRQSSHDPVRGRIGVEIQGGVIARELRMVESVEGIDAELDRKSVV